MGHGLRRGQRHHAVLLGMAWRGDLDGGPARCRPGSVTASRERRRGSTPLSLAIGALALALCAYLAAVFLTIETEGDVARRLPPPGAAGGRRASVALATAGVAARATWQRRTCWRGLFAPADAARRWRSAGGGAAVGLARSCGGATGWRGAPPWRRSALLFAGLGPGAVSLSIYPDWR